MLRPGLVLYEREQQQCPCWLGLHHCARGSHVDDRADLTDDEKKTMEEAKTKEI
jgi:hypothetical protein